MNEDKKLLLVDGNSIINRAFFALPPMDNGEGMHTNAIYGFLTMLIKMINTYKPTHISVAFDMKAPTFRHKKYTDYKAGRKKMANELAMQLNPLKEILDTLNIDRREIEGYEADDILGTVSLKAQNDGFTTYIVTGDRDAIQLASDNTIVLITKKGVGEVETYDREGVYERYELTPSQFIDLKGLMGDKSDNIPGIPGIGEKTGIKFLKEFKTLEGVLDNADKLTKSQRTKVEENRDLAIMSKDLATIFREVPIDFKLEDMEFTGDFDTEKVREVLLKLKFNSIVSRILDLSENGEEDIEEDVDVSFFSEKTMSSEDILEIKKKIKESEKMYIKSFSDGKNVLEKGLYRMYFYVDDKIYYVDERNLDSISDLLEDEYIEKIGFDIKEDYLALLPYNIELSNLGFDIAIAEYIIDAQSSNSYSYEIIANKYLFKKYPSYEEVVGKNTKVVPFSDLKDEDINTLAYSILSTVVNVEEKMRKIIKDDSMEMLMYDVEMPLVEVLGSMEYFGIAVDEDMVENMSMQLDEMIKKYEDDIYNAAGEKFNINSPKQLGVILFDKLELPVIKKTKTGYSTNAEVLEKLRDKHPIIDMITDYRSVVKLKSTYVDGIKSLINPIDGRIHSSFNQTIASTGRISSTDPNMQNIPVRTELGRQIRKFFVAENSKKLLDADYSQVELRVLADMSGDEDMIEAFKSGVDIHRRTASQVFSIPFEEVDSEKRSAAKAINFGIIYGKSDFGLSQDLGISQKAASSYIKSYFDRYPKIKGFMDKIVAEAEETGYSTTMLNRRRYIPDIKSSNFILKNRGKRAAMNAPIQGSAADIIKIAMVNVYNRLKDEKIPAKLILQVHDELIVEAEESAVELASKILKEEMENAVSLKVNLDVDLNVGDSWYETK